MLFVQGRDPLTQIPILDAHQRQCAFINPKDNRAFLSEAFLQSLQAMPDRQRRRFYEGIYQAEIDGALWTFETIEHARCLPEDVPRDLKRVVVSVDPSGTRGDEDQRSDNIGIVAVGLGMAGKLGNVLGFHRTSPNVSEAILIKPTTRGRPVASARVVASMRYRRP